MARNKIARRSSPLVHIAIDSNVDVIIARTNMLLSGAGLAVWLHSLDPWFRARAVDRFRNEGDDASGMWKPLSPSTIRMRHQLGFGSGPINFRTGELEQFITQSPGNVTVLDPSTAMMAYLDRVPMDGDIGWKVKTAQWGRSGKGRNQGAAPARPVMAFGSTDLAHALGSLAIYILSGASAGAPMNVVRP